MTEKEIADIDRLAESIALRVWRKMRAYIRKQNRELQDLYEEE